ncbi:ATP-binding cassette domain-containing protein [Clostridium sporogenes]|uniref:ATP-binding cassette domain-containing protein n=1 Tax=Clostridium sporogenes TaxID=1509 RepID=UPI00214A6324|nr:ATP-binding cassette domain-containing protein [Clostridium sporogenes]MCR1975372.1 ATP-binding cassette domain-containing protein [Clostridium sporogenes]
MSEYILKTTNLSKRYKKDFAVNNLNISIKRGEIYGFIGENGAGKTTFIRMITGLVYPTSGEIKLFSKEKGDELGNVRKRIGALIERPAFYPYMTAYENLEAFRIEKGIPGKECIDKTLKSVGLYGDKNKKLKNFSLGMKQKLALAIALLGDPEFLILDEPINGLDPMGIKEIRELLKNLNKEKNITMLISSHILGELYQLATCYGIIHKGKLIEQITLKELDEKCKRSLSIKVDDVNKAATILETELSTNNFKIFPDGTIKLYDYVDNPRLVSSTLTKQNIIIDQIMPNESNLEEYFINLVGGDLK